MAKRRNRQKISGRVLARIPWEMSEERKPGEPIVSREQRMPPEAAEAGKLIAQMSARGGVILGLAGIVLPDRCKSCAFREGTVPNRCIDTVGDAIKCVMEGHRFLCHEPRDGESYLDRACYGAMRARAWAVEAKKNPAEFRAIRGAR